MKTVFCDELERIMSTVYDLFTAKIDGLTALRTAQAESRDGHSIVRMDLHAVAGIGGALQAHDAMEGIEDDSVVQNIPHRLR